MKKRIVPVMVILALAAGAWWWFQHRRPQSDELVLFGNVDLRQVALPFADSERIAEVLVQEGDVVRAGQPLARLDTGRLMPRRARAEAQAASQSQALRRLQRGSRPEEIAQARAAVDSAEADLENATKQYKRLTGVEITSAGRAVSDKDLEASQANLKMAQARLDGNQKALDLSVAGPRAEDIAQAKAQLDGATAEIALLRRQLEDAELRSPTNGVVRSRLMEPGEMASPQRPVLSLAITDPKWVRAYVSEASLGRVKSGTTARIAVDSFANETFEGWVGFVSSVAEFTPKTVQTEDLRTNLVYEVRVFLKDPQDRLRLGMPATVRFTNDSTPKAASR